MVNDFSEFLIKEYVYWSVSIAENQSYLGRCVVWCKREDALDLAGATEEEQKELFKILQELRLAVSKAFAPDWFNYAFLGNDTRHLHAHFVPRYAKPNIFMGVAFEDKLYGHNYKTDHAFKISSEILKAVRDKIRDVLV